MNIGADMRLDTPSLPRQALREPLVEAVQPEAPTDHLIDLTVSPVTEGIGFPAKEVSPMYSPVSVGFFGLTGTAVGAAGISGSFGGLTSLVITLAVLLVLFASVLAARVVARRRFGRAISR
jgi:hypothetical protein